MRDVPTVVVALMAEAHLLLNSGTTQERLCDWEATAARIPAQDVTARQHTGAHWTDCTDGIPRPQCTRRTGAHQADGFEEA
jgi:hypothetical protein